MSRRSAGRRIGHTAASVACLALSLVALVAACGGTATTASIGSTYDDPENAYTLQVDPGWELQAGTFAEGVEFWFLGPPENGFRPNVNLLTQAAPGMSLADYTAMSEKSAPSLMSDFVLITKGPVGSDLEMMNYTGSMQGRSMHFLAVFGVHSGRAVIATLTAPNDTFATWRAKVEPFLQTLRLR